MIRRVAIIGAGPAGLCAIKQFTSTSSGELFSVQAFEQCAELGGIWVYTNKTKMDEETGLPVSSAIYQGLRLNTPTVISAFPDYPFPEDCPSFLHHADLLEYLKRYAEQFDLENSITYKTHVERVTPVPVDGKECSEQGLDNVLWEIQYKNLVSGEQKTDMFDAVLICSGKFTKPHYPAVLDLEKFPGSVIHSHDYRVHDGYRDQRVLVMGAGSSGVDIALRLTHVASVVYLSHKCRFSCPLPANLHQTTALQDAGSDGIVTFADGEKIKVDSIIVCTGYDFHFPFLSPQCRTTVGLTVQSDHVYPLYKRTINVNHPSMAIIGLPYDIIPFPTIYYQICFVLAVWTGKTSLPERGAMRVEVDEQLAILSPKHPRDRKRSRYVGFYMDKARHWPYLSELAELGHVKPPGTVIASLYKECFRRRDLSLMGFREFSYVITDDNHFEVITNDQD